MMEICERCQSMDGRRVGEYAVKGSARAFCDDCARVTATVHAISPEPPEAQEAEAAPAEVPETDADESSTAEPEEGTAETESSTGDEAQEAEAAPAANKKARSRKRAN